MDIFAQIKEAGIVGAGGAGFPTWLKMAAKPEIILVNGAECEPLLKVDQVLMAAHATELAEALNLLLEASGATEGIFALKEKYHEGHKALTEAIKAYPKLRIYLLGNYYPAGDEQVTVYEATGRIVPEGGIPINVGVVVVNVETLLNIHGATRGEPLTEKYLTIMGEVKKPATIKVPLGISLREAIDLCGGPLLKDFAVINGGPLMGGLVKSLDEPVTKTTKGLILLPLDHYWVVSKAKSTALMMREGKTPCCHCMLCTDLCPRYLLGHELYPDKMMRLASYNSTCEKDTAATQAFLCCECALCELACIMNLQPWKLNQELKKKMAAAGIKNPHHNAPAEVRPFREGRRYPADKVYQKLAITKYKGKADLDLSLTIQPKTVNLKLKQHLGAPPIPIVQVGDSVDRGQLIAVWPDNPGPSAALHSSIKGSVAAITDDFIQIRGL